VPEYLEVAGRMVLALVFIASATAKLLGRARFNAFTSGIRDLRLLPTRAVTLAASLVVVAELALPALVAFPRTALAGLLLAAALLTLFTGVIGTVLRRRTRAACPCFGFPAVSFGRRHLVRNGILLTITVAAIVAGNAAVGSLAPGGAVVAALAALVVGILIVSFDELADLVSGPTRERS
jgi:hypothetical protein